MRPTSTFFIIQLSNSRSVYLPALLVIHPKASFQSHAIPPIVSGIIGAGNRKTRNGLKLYGSIGKIPSLTVK